MILEAVALFSLSQIISVTNPVYYLYPILVVYGAGVGLAISQVTSTVLMSIPWQKAGIGSGANNTVRQVGSAFGIAVIGAVLVAIISSVGQAQVATDIANGSLPISSRAVLDGLLNAGLSGGIGQIPPGLPVGTVIQIFNDAITEGTRWAAFTAAIFVSFGALSSLLIPNTRGKTDAKVNPSVIPRESVRVESRVRAVIVVQFATILGLLVAISWDYQQNTFTQQWFTNNASPIGYLLNNFIGTIFVAIVGLALIGWKLVPRQQGRRALKPKN